MRKILIKIKRGSRKLYNIGIMWSEMEWIFLKHKESLLAAMEHHQRGFLVFIICFLRSSQVSHSSGLTIDNQLVIIANGEWQRLIADSIPNTMIKRDNYIMQIAIQEWLSDLNYRTWTSSPASRLVAFRNARTNVRREGIPVTRLLSGTR